MNEIRVGVIGVGYLGQYHAEKYSQMDNVNLVGVADIDQARAEAIAARYDSRAFTDYRDLLCKVDAVSIVVPTESHFDVGLESLKRDVDVMIEKPMTTTLEQADKLIEIAETKRRILQVGHLERFNPAVLALKDFITRPMFIEVHRLSIFKDRSTDVSVVLDLMIHDIDILLNIVKSNIQSIHAAGVPVICDHADIANVRMQFNSGCVANVTASRISTKNQRKIRIFQKDTYISVDFASREITLIRRNEKNSNSVVPGMEFQQMCFTEADVLEDELTSYVQSVSTRKAPVVSGHAGRKALAVALDIMGQVDEAIEKYLN
ncbi:MAG: Gfo/Idh/MocA family oxidoreductase [Desulfobacterales bacterium]|nr:Gfo/Idh/MocA family oxidoreductase [Desulfobacterales bacterium]